MHVELKYLNFAMHSEPRMRGNPKVGTLLEKPKQTDVKKSKTKVGFLWHLKNRKPKLNSHNFSNVCLITESFSWSSSTLQTVMFTTVYGWWPAGTIVRLQINKTAKPTLHI